MTDNLVDSKDYIDFSVSNPFYRKSRDYYFIRIKLFFHDGTEKTLYRGGFKTKKEASKEQNIIIGQLYTKTFIIKNNVNTGEFFVNWLENIIKPKLTHNSYNSYKNIVYNYIENNFKNTNLLDLQSGKLLEFYEKINNKSHSVLKLCHTVIVSGLDFAVKKKILTVNPARNIKLPKAKLPYRTRSININDTLTLEQLKKLVNSSKNTPIYLYILFAGLMGLRRGEILGLKYSDVDFLHRTLTVNRQLGIDPKKSKNSVMKKQYTKQEIGLKSSSSNRVLEIPDIVFEEILKERKIYEKNRHSRINDKSNPFRDWNYIICSSYGNPRSNGYHIKYFKELLDLNDLPNIRFHDLRKTYSTLLLENGFSGKAISKLMGHASEIITVDVYGDKKNMVCEPINELEEYIDKVLPKNEESNFKTSDVMIDENLIRKLTK